MKYLTITVVFLVGDCLLLSIALFFYFLFWVGRGVCAGSEAVIEKLARYRIMMEGWYK